MLTPKQSKLLAALLVEPTIERAAKTAGMSVRTAYDLRQSPEFAEEYQKACAEMLKSAAREAQRTMPSAVATLRGIMESDMSMDADRIRAARIILADGVRLTEVADIEERLEALENARDN